MSFLKNCWYVAALSDELRGEELLRRKLLGVAVLMFRKENGEVVAMRDRCPHRFAPLSRGKRDGDVVICPYHGLRFDANGMCVGNPHGDESIPKGAIVNTYPLVERDGFAWIWMGDRAPEPERIPDYSLVSQGPASAVGYAVMSIPAHYELVVDNIMDLSHADFVHGPLLNTNGQLTAAGSEISGGKETVTVRWEWTQSPAQGFFAQFLPDATGDAEQWVEVGWTAPASMYLYVGAVQGSRDYDKGLIFWANHIMTPETETSTHYFYAGRRNWHVEDEALNDAFLAATLNAFATEDTPMVSAVQDEMETSDLLAMHPAILACDAGAVRARRKLASMIREEQAAGLIAKT